MNSHYPYTFTSLLQQTLKQNHRALHNCYSAKNMLKLLAFKWLLNKLSLETEWSEVMLIWRFVSIRFINSFLKLCYLISLFNDFPCNFNFTGKTVLFPSTDIIMVALLCFSSAFFSSERYLLLFFAHVFKNIVKPKCKTTLSKLLKDYIRYIFLILGIQN